MIITCEWHKPAPIVIGEKEPIDDRSITGGMCAECQKKMEAEIEALDPRLYRDLEKAFGA